MVRERAGKGNFCDAFIIPYTSLAPRLNLHTLFPVIYPVEVDIGCGRGRFLLARARQNPHAHFVGIDRVLLRLRKLDRKAVDAGLTNIRLIRGDARNVIGDILSPGTVSAFYVFFPDPWPKRRHQVHRLVSPPFIDGIHAALVEAGVIHLCTDHDEYFSAMCKLWRQESRFEEVPPFIPTDDEETDFGKLFGSLSRPAKRCSFRKLPCPNRGTPQTPPALDEAGKSRPLNPSGSA